MKGWLFVAHIQHFHVAVAALVVSFLSQFCIILIHCCIYYRPGFWTYESLLLRYDGDFFNMHLKRVWRYQRGNQNPYIEEQTTQWPNEKGHKRTNNDLKNIHIKLKIEYPYPTKTLGWTQVLRKRKQFLVH